MRSGKPAEEFLRVLVEPADHIPETKLFHRGDYRQPQADGRALAHCRFAVRKAAALEFAAKSDALPTTGRRLAFARWLTGSRQSADGARAGESGVDASLWSRHRDDARRFRPSWARCPRIPTLLDWLAAEFRDSGWSLKRLHRAIMLSTAYRQSSRARSGETAIDSDNRYYGRQNVVRLDAESLRDRVLAASGVLDRTLFGPPIAVKEDDSGQVVVAGDVQRRSMYLSQRRSQPVALMQAFDVAGDADELRAAAFVDRGDAIVDADERRILADPGDGVGGTSAEREPAQACPLS